MESNNLEFSLVILGAIAIAGYNYFTKHPISTKDIILGAMAVIGPLLGMIALFFIIRFISRKLDQRAYRKCERINQLAKEHEKQEKEEYERQQIQKLNENYEKTIKPLLTAPRTQNKIDRLQQQLEEIYKAQVKIDHTEEHQEIALEIHQEIHETEKHLQRQEEAKKQQLNLDKDIHKETELNQEQIQILQQHGYTKAKHVPLNQQAPQTYYLKPRFNESTAHYFLTMQITDYLRSKNIIARTPETRDADIIFQANNQTWAIEIETGKVKTKNEEKFQNKIRLLNERYGNNWFIVLTNNKMIKHYRAKRYNIVQKSKVMERIGGILTDDAKPN